MTNRASLKMTRLSKLVGNWSMEQMPPTRVCVALIALWAAWAVSAVALFVNQVLFHGSGIGPGPSIGIVSLAVQAVAFGFVGRGSATARSFVIVFLTLAALPLGILPRLFAERAVYAASYLVVGFALKAIAVWLLFTGDSAEWFARSGQT
jgi:hypothetical protein